MRVGRSSRARARASGVPTRRSEATSSSSIRPRSAASLSAAFCERELGGGLQFALARGREAAQGLDEQEVTAGRVGGELAEEEGVIAGQGRVLGGEGDADLEAQDLGLLAVDLGAGGGEDRRVARRDRDDRLHHQGPGGEGVGHARGQLVGARIAAQQGVDDLGESGLRTRARVRARALAEASALSRPSSAAVSSHHGSAAPGCRRVATSAGAGLGPVLGLDGLEGEVGVEAAVERAHAQGCLMGQVAGGASGAGCAP
jgi:hypothetical protein